MRASFAVLGLSLLSAGLGAAELASAGKHHLGDGGGDALKGQGTRYERLELPFNLAAPAQVLAQAEGLRFIDLGSDAAPEAFVDEQYLGPLRAEHGGTWRSLRSARLQPGPHVFTLRNARVQDAEDFVLERIFVYADAPRSQGLRLSKPVPKDGPRLGPENGCNTEARRDWPAAFKTGLTLSVLSGQVIGSGELVRLKQGQSWACGLKVTGRSRKPLPLLARFERKEGVAGRWILALDPEPPPRVEELGFKSARWERFHAQLCEGLLTLQFGSSPAWTLRWPDPEISFEIAAQSVEISLRPLP